MHDLQQEISDASDEAAQQYLNETPDDERSDSEVARLMKAAAKSKMTTLKGQWSKYSAVANPKLGAEFLQEVFYHH